MSDPLSIAGGVAGLISLGIQVTQSLVDFYTSYKHQDSKLIGTIEKLESLLIILKSLEKTLSNRKFQVDERSLIKNIETSIENCDELIRELHGECQKFSKATSNGINAVAKVAGRRATYPFRQSTLQKLDEDIGEIRDNLSIAIDVLQLKDNKKIQDDIADMRLLLDLVRTSQISRNICDWLKAPDATVNHHAACEKRHPGTGAWFVKSSTFTAWLTEENSFLWLNGFAGSGKSVLSSTAIQFAFRHRRSVPSIGIAFFYFTFNDESKQDESAMLRALLVQLSGQLQDGHSDLTRLHDSSKTGRPTSSVLLDYLRRLIQRFHHVYIILDALDESPRDGARERVLDTIETMQNWFLPGLHLLVTSRDLSDIRSSLKHSSEQEVKMRNTEIDKDIGNFISSRLHEDRRLQKWLPYNSKIQETLGKRAQGVFRWVECQFQSLKSCPRSEDHLDRLLNSLPQSLDETYERMLCSIDDNLIEDAQRILTLLCFAARPLTVLELIDGVAVEINSGKLNPKHRLQDANDVHEICLGLVDIGISTDNMTEIHSENLRMQTVRIAHFSVQEYLESERIQRQKATIFSLTGARAHTDIAQICLIYWLEPGLAVTELDAYSQEKYPLAHFAAKFWYHHYKNAENGDSKLENLVLKLFQREKGLFLTWIRLLHPDEQKPFPEFWGFSVPNKSPVYYASLLGLGRIVQELISPTQQEIIPPASMSKDVDVNTQGGYYGHSLEAASSQGYENIVELLLEKGADVNAQGGKYGNALQAASFQGNDKVVQLLVKKGADVNAQGGFYGNALQAASDGGHEKIVQLLIENGADINAQGGKYGNALQAASKIGHEKIVQLLIENGANANARGGYYGNALQAASIIGHKKIVQLLIKKDWDVSARGGYYGNALQAAAIIGHEKIVQLLIEKGADFDAQGGYYGNALQAAAEGGHEKIVQLLIEKGADVNTQGGKYGNALQAASRRGHEGILQLLVEKGADVNAQGGYYGNALQAASYQGREKTLQLLVKNGADVNAQGGNYGTALQAASKGGHEEIFQLLIENGADIHSQGGYYGNALQAASVKGHKKIVQLLIEKGADINAQGGYYGNALQAASYQGHEKILQLLVEKGADFNAQGENYGNALQAASQGGHEKIVQLLVEKGADVNAQGGYYGNALQAASGKGHKKIVQLLIGKGADVNAQGGFYGTAMQAASRGSYEEIIQLLAENGADIHAQGGHYGNALQAASGKGHKKIVQLLIEKGADVNIQGGKFGNALQAALRGGHEEILQLLVEKGADFYAQG